MSNDEAELCPVCYENPADLLTGITLGPCNHTVCTVCALNFIRFALDKAVEGDYFEKLTKDYQHRINQHINGTFGSGTSSLRGLLGPIACPICVNSDLPVGPYPQGWITEACISKLSPLPLGQITRTFTGDGSSSSSTPAVSTSLNRNEVARYMRSVNACAILYGNNNDNARASLSSTHDHSNVHGSHCSHSSSEDTLLTIASLTTTTTTTTDPTRFHIRVCPNHRCEEILVMNDLVVSPSSDTAMFDPIMRTCAYCDEHLCGGCGLRWTEESLGERHFGRTCEQWAALLVDSDAATRAILNNTRGRKQCGRCGYIVERWRGHACHHVKCKCGAEMCYVCMGDWKGECPNKCPFRCSDECDCVPCPDCKPGKNCYYCSGGCPSCNGETEDQALERESRQVVARRTKLSTGWCGPRQTWRKDVVASTSTASEAAELAAATSRPKTAKDIIRILARTVNTYSFDECMTAEVLRTISVLLGNPSVGVDEKVTVFDALQLWQPNLGSSQSSSTGRSSSPSVSGGSSGILQPGVPVWMSMYNLYPHSDEVLAAAIEFIYVSSAGGRSGGGDTSHFQIEQVRSLFERVLHLCERYKDSIFTSKSSTYYNILLYSMQTITEAFTSESGSSSSSSSKGPTPLKLTRRSWATKLVHARAPELLCEIFSLAVSALDYAQREEEELATSLVRTPSGRVKKFQSPAQMRAWAIIRYASNTIRAFISMAFEPEASERFMAKIALDKIVACHGIQLIPRVLELVGRDLNSQKSITSTHWGIIILAIKLFTFKDSSNGANESSNVSKTDTTVMITKDDIDTTSFTKEKQHLETSLNEIGLSKLLKLCRKSTSLSTDDSQLIDNTLVSLLISSGDITPTFGRFLGRAARKELVRAECESSSNPNLYSLIAVNTFGNLLNRSDTASFAARLVAITEFIRKRKPGDSSDDEDADDDDDNDMNSDFIGSSTEDDDSSSDDGSSSDDDSDGDDVDYDGEGYDEEDIAAEADEIRVIESLDNRNESEEESKVSENDSGSSPTDHDMIELELPTSLTVAAVSTLPKCKYCKQTKSDICKYGCSPFIDVTTKTLRKILGKRDQDTFPLKPTDSSHSSFINPRYGAEVLVQALACTNLWTTTGTRETIRRVSVAIGQHIINVLASSPSRSASSQTKEKSVVSPIPPTVEYGNTVTFDSLTRVAGIAVEYGLPGLRLSSTSSSEESGSPLIEKHPNGLTSFALLYLRLVAEELSYVPGYSSSQYSLANYLHSDTSNSSNNTIGNNGEKNTKDEETTVHRNIQKSLLNLKPLFSILQNEIQPQSSDVPFITTSTFPRSFPIRFFLTSFATISEIFRVGINGTQTTPYYRPSQELQSIESRYGGSTLYYQPQAIVGGVRIMKHFIVKYKNLSVNELINMFENPDVEFTFYRTFIQFFLPHFTALIPECASQYSSNERHRSTAMLCLDNGLADIAFSSMELMQRLISHIQSDSTLPLSSAVISMIDTFLDDCMAMVDTFTLCTMVLIRRSGIDVMIRRTGIVEPIKPMLGELVEKLAILMTNCYQMDSLVIRPNFIRLFNQCIMARPSSDNYLFMENGPLYGISGTSFANVASEYLVSFKHSDYRIYSYIFLKNFIEHKGLDGYLNRMRKVLTAVKSKASEGSASNAVVSTTPVSPIFSKYSFSIICGISYGIMKCHEDFSEKFAVTYHATIRDIFLDSVSVLSSEQLIGIQFDEISNLFDYLYTAQNHFLTSYGESKEESRLKILGKFSTTKDIDPEKLKKEKEKLKLACIKCSLADSNCTVSEKTEALSQLYQMCTEACSGSNVLRPRSESSSSSIKEYSPKNFFIMLRDNNVLNLIINSMDNMSIGDIYTYASTLLNGYDSYSWRSDSYSVIEYAAQFTRDYQNLKLCYPGSTILEGLEGCGLQPHHLQKLVTITFKIAKDHMDHSAEYVLRQGLGMLARKSSLEMRYNLSTFFGAPECLRIIYKYTNYLEIVCSIADYSIQALNTVIDNYITVVQEEEQMDDKANGTVRNESIEKQKQRIRATLLPEYIRNFLVRDKSLFGYRIAWDCINSTEEYLPGDSESDGEESSTNIPLIPSDDIRDNAVNHLNTCVSRIHDIDILKSLMIKGFQALRDKRGTSCLSSTLVNIHDRLHDLISEQILNEWNDLKKSEEKENERLKSENPNHKDTEKITVELRTTMTKDMYRRLIQEIEHELVSDSNGSTPSSNITVTSSSESNATNAYLGTELFSAIATDIESQVTLYKETAIRKQETLENVYLLGKSFRSSISERIQLIGQLVNKDRTCQISVSAITRIWDALVDLPHDSIINYVLDEFSGFCCNEHGTCWHGIPPESALALMERARAVENREETISTSTYFTCLWNLFVDSNAGMGMIKGRDDYRHYPAINPWKLKGVDTLWESFLHSTLNSVSDTMVPLLPRLFLNLPESLPLGSLLHSTASVTDVEDDTKLQVWATLIRKSISGIHRAIELDTERKSKEKKEKDTSTITTPKEITSPANANDNLIQSTAEVGSSIDISSSTATLVSATESLQKPLGQVKISKLSQPLAFTIMRVCLLLDAILTKFRTSYPEIVNTNRKSVAVPLTVPVTTAFTFQRKTVSKPDSLQIERSDDDKDDESNVNNDTNKEEEEEEKNCIFQQSFTVHSLFNRSSGSEKSFTPLEKTIYIRKGFETMGEIRDRISEHVGRSPKSVILYTRGSLIKGTAPVYYWDDTEIINNRIPNLICEIYVHGYHPLLTHRKKATTRDERILAVKERIQHTNEGSKGMGNDIVPSTTSSVEINTPDVSVTVTEHQEQLSLSTTSSSVIIESSTTVPGSSINSNNDKSSNVAISSSSLSSSSTSESTKMKCRQIFEYLGQIIKQDTVTLDYILSLASEENRSSYAHCQSKHIIYLLMREHCKNLKDYANEEKDYDNNDANDDNETNSHNSTGSSSSDGGTTDDEQSENSDATEEF